MRATTTAGCWVSVVAVMIRSIAIASRPHHVRALLCNASFHPVQSFGRFGHRRSGRQYTGATTPSRCRLDPHNDHHPIASCIRNKNGVAEVHVGVDVADDDAAQSLLTAQTALQQWARRSRSWQRLRHLVELSLAAPPVVVVPVLRTSRATTTTVTTTNNNSGSIADVGTDHGMLAMALAASGKFDRVYGVDVSLAALQNGAWKLQQQVLASQQQQYLAAAATTTATTTNQQHWSPVEFLLGDGLAALRPGQADTVCIAGMGVHTMVEILRATTTASTTTTNIVNALDEAAPAPPLLLWLDELGCQRLILQSTDSRPRQLMRLYETLGDLGWTVTDERIEYLASRWYLSSSFVRRHDNNNNNSATARAGGCAGVFPGSLLATTSCDEMRPIYLHWVHHHCKWILQTWVKAGTLSHHHRREAVWLNEFMHDNKL